MIPEKITCHLVVPLSDVKKRQTDQCLLYEHMTPKGKELAKKVALMIGKFNKNEKTLIPATIEGKTYEFSEIHPKVFPIPSIPHKKRPVYPGGFRLIAQHTDEIMRLFEAVATYNLLKEAGINCKMCPSKTSPSGMHYSVFVYPKSTIKYRMKAKLPNTPMAELAQKISKLPETDGLLTRYEPQNIEGEDVEQIKITKFPKTIEARKSWSSLMKKVEEMGREMGITLYFAERRHPEIINRWSRYPKPIIARSNDVLDLHNNEVRVDHTKDFDAVIENLQRNLNKKKAQTRAEKKKGAPSSKKRQKKAPEPTTQQQKPADKPVSRFAVMAFKVLRKVLGAVLGQKVFYIMGFDPENLPSDTDIEMMQDIVFPGSKMKSLDEIEKTATKGK